MRGDVLDLDSMGGDDAMGLEVRDRDDDALDLEVRGRDKNALGQKKDADAREDDAGKNKGLGEAAEEIRVTKDCKEGERITEQTAMICLTGL